MNELVDKFNAVPTTQRLVGLIVAVLAILGIFWFAFYSPTLTDIKNQKQRVDALQREKQSLAEFKRRKAKVLAELESLSSQLTEAQDKLPKDAEIPSLLQRIHNQAKTAGLEIKRFQRKPDAAKDFYVEIPVEMELAGTYDNLADFFYYIGRMTRIVNVSDISMKRKDTKLEGTGDLVVTAKAKTFRDKSDAEMAPAKKGRRGRK